MTNAYDKTVRNIFIQSKLTINAGDEYDSNVPLQSSSDSHSDDRRRCTVRNFLSPLQTSSQHMLHSLPLSACISVYTGPLPTRCWRGQQRPRRSFTCRSGAVISFWWCVSGSAGGGAGHALLPAAALAAVAVLVVLLLLLLLLLRDNWPAALSLLLRAPGEACRAQVVTARFPTSAAAAPAAQ